MTDQPLLEQLVSTIEQMQGQIETLQGHVATLTVRGRLGGTPLPEQPEQQDDLPGWVSWLIKHYDLTEAIPACWSKHVPIQEELNALHLAYSGAYDDIDGKPTEPLQWHEALQRCLARIRDWDRSKCRSRGHQADDECRVGTTLH